MPNPNRQARYPRDLVKLLNENIDLDALVFDTDASGNPIVVDSKSGDTIAFYDRDTGEWNLSDINVQSLDADSVSTDSVNTGWATVTNQVDAGSVNTDDLNIVDTVVNNTAPRKNIREFNASTDVNYNTGDTVQLFQFVNNAANNVTLTGKMDVFGVNVNGNQSFQYLNLGFVSKNNDGGTFSSTETLNSNVELVPTNGGDNLTCEVTSPEDFQYISCSVTVWTYDSEPIEILV